MWEIDLFCVCINYHILDGGSLRASIGVDALHHQFKLI
jgi:hypothetical protein